MINVHKINNNIYITSDEEIKEGDWYLLPLFKGGCEIKKYNSEKHFAKEPCISLANLKAKKIILTTDPQLIADGVQPKEPFNLDEMESKLDEALSKETNESLTDWLDGKREQEEPKQPICEHIKEYGCIKDICTCNTGPKQESTLEEAAKSKAFEFSVDYKPWETSLDYREYAEYGFEKGFIAGAKWQQERMYSEEEVIQLLNNCRGENPIDIKKWFEQYKKK